MLLRSAPMIGGGSQNQQKTCICQDCDQLGFFDSRLLLFRDYCSNSKGK